MGNYDDVVRHLSDRALLEHVNAKLKRLTSDERAKEFAREVERRRKLRERKRLALVVAVVALGLLALEWIARDLYRDALGQGAAGAIAPVVQWARLILMAAATAAGVVASICALAAAPDLGSAFAEELDAPTTGKPRKTPNTPDPPGTEPAPRNGYPRPPTRTVGATVLFLAVSLVLLLIAALAFPEAVDNEYFGIVCGGNVGCTDLPTLVIVVLAGGVGSMISAISAYLQHAGERQDFRHAYMPWYVGRPLTGMMLAIVFYFALKGGLVALGATGPVILNTYSLAGVGALVGMFSKNAVEKLREVFNVLFKSVADVEDQVLNSVDEEYRPAVAKALNKRRGGGKP